MARYSFPAWSKDLQERVNATGGEGMPGIVQNFDLFNLAGRLVVKNGFLAEFEVLLGRYEKIVIIQRSILAEGEYLVPVIYAPLPSFEKLEQEFGKGNVSKIFDGRPFTKHASCINVDEAHGDYIFLVKHFGREINSDTAIAEMDKLGYRPATHIEAYEFQKAHPDLQRQFYIVALGSFAEDGGDQCVAVLGSYFDRRVFSIRCYGFKWDTGGRFLFVRK